MKLSQYERETIINYNEADKTASIYTHNAALRRRLDQLLKTRPDEIAVERTGDDYTEYVVPKKWIKVSPPKKVSEETKERARQRINEYWQNVKGTSIESSPQKDNVEL